MRGKIIIPKYRLWLRGLYGLHRPWCPMSEKVRWTHWLTHWHTDSLTDSLAVCLPDWLIHSKQLHTKSCYPVPNYVVMPHPKMKLILPGGHYYWNYVPLPCAVKPEETLWNNTLSWWYDGSAGKHDNVIKWKHFPRHWPFVKGIKRSPVDSP